MLDSANRQQSDSTSGSANVGAGTRYKSQSGLICPGRLRVALWFVTLAPGLLSGCQPPGSAPAPAAKAAASSAPAPSKVSGGVKESDLATVTLTADAERRLGIKTVTVERKALPLAVSYGGEVMIPQGHLISVTSPFPATLKTPPRGAVPQVGAWLKRGQAIFVLEPNLSPGERATMASSLIDVEGQVKQAEEQLKVAKINLDRQDNLVRQKLAGAATLVDAKGQYSVAQTALRAAENRRDVIQKMVMESNAGGLTTQTADAPVPGVLQNLHAQVDQKVAAGAILFDVAEMDPMWVKVPVYVGDLERLATDRPAGIGSLADPPGVRVRQARPVTAPPSGDPLAATVHLYYEVENHDHALRPGQRVGVTLPLRGDEDSLIVPYSALIRDALGGTWVYETVADHAYARRRVFVDRVVGELAGLTRGPKSGARVVTQGAAELYGAEFGGQK
jgi:RND family efflux transporter MFP subunit